MVKSRQTKDWHSIYYIVNEKGITLKELDTSKYMICFSEDKLGYFAVFAIRNEKGWIAINSDEKKLFEVYNTSFGEPSPDELVENKIRIINAENKIGFADKKGNIIIKPQFEMVSTFYKGKAIIAENCEKIPWNTNENLHSGCHHYSLVCKRNGYIDINGNIKLIGDFTFEQIEKKIKWKHPQ